MVRTNPDAVRRRLVAAGAPEQHQLHAAVHHRHGRQVGPAGRAGRAAAARPRCPPSRSSLMPRCTSKSTKPPTRVTDRYLISSICGTSIGAVPPRHETRRERHVVVLQRVGMIAHDRHAVDQIERRALRTTWLRPQPFPAATSRIRSSSSGRHGRLTVTLAPVLHEELGRPVVGLLGAVAQRRAPTWPRARLCGT